jgi:4-hydroxybenzoate polyprenyltransferase
MDRPLDVLHPVKALRPFASGELSVSDGLAIVVVLLILALAVGFGAGGFSFMVCLGIYFSMGQAYTLVAKHVPVLDVLMLSVMYTYRIFAGSLIAGGPLPSWLVCFSLFWFLSLALFKRAAELSAYSHQAAKARQTYAVSDLRAIACFGLAAAGLASTIMLHSLPSIAAAHTEGLEIPGFIGPLMIGWIFTMWALGLAGRVKADPVCFAVSHPLSLFWVVCAVASFAMYGI